MLAPLVGKPLAIISDARLGGANTNQVVERLLSISGEDMLTVDVKYQEQWTGTLPTRFVVISNELPRFGDASGAIATRFVTLVLSRSWLGRENTKLTDELREELPGILSWALDGLDRLEVSVKDLYDAWKAWAEDNGHRPGSSQTFGRDLRAAHSHAHVRRPRDDEGRQQRFYVGLTLASRVRTGSDNAK